MLLAFLAMKSVIYKEVILWEKGTFGMVFVMGTNVNSGFWNQEDYDYLKSLLIEYDNNAERVNREAFKLALWRLSRVMISNLWSPQGLQYVVYRYLWF